MSKHRRKVPLYPCRCNCHDKSFREMARCAEHSSHSECWREITMQNNHGYIYYCMLHAELALERGE